MMDMLDKVAQEIANEANMGKWPNFTHQQQDPDTCLSILKEFQSRAHGYDIEDYVHALANAMKALGYK